MTGSVADVIIVGAGVAGLYCAERILADDPGRRVVVLDRLGRVGGRLDTDIVHIKELDHFDATGALIEGRVVPVKEEEGGMRFNAAMPELLALLDALGMWDSVMPFGMGNDDNVFHVRGRSFTAGQSKRGDHAIWSELYDLAPHERGKSPGEIVMAVYRDLVLGNGDLPPDNPTPEFWQRFRLDFTHRGLPLNEWGLWSLLRSFGLSVECIAMLADTTGFQAPFHDASSAGVAMQLLEDFPLDPEFFTLRDGFGSLPAALAASVRDRGGAVRLSRRVTSVGRDADSHVVHLEDGGSIACGTVILALPPQALRTLAATSPVLRCAAVERAIAAALPMRLCKVNLYYSHAWWRDGSETRLPRVRNGGSFTTQPMGAVYAFDPVPGESLAAPAALTIYNDFIKTEFWRQLQEQGPMFDSVAQREQDRVRPQVMFAASEAVVTEATTQLREMFNMIAVPRPVLTSYRLWDGAGEFGYAYHQWARGVDDRAVMRDVAQPFERVFVCNEAFSDDQGWVNGSLRSADRVLAAGFAIAPLPRTARALPSHSPDPETAVIQLPLAVERAPAQ